MNRSSLLVIRAPTAERHAWLGDIEPRTWDLAISTYRSAERFGAAPDVIVDHRAGYRWPPISELIRRLILEGRTYRFVWLLPDDVTVSRDAIETFLSIVQEHDFAVAQPALTATSYVNLPVTVALPDSLARITNFVEIMSPCVRWDVLLGILPRLSEMRFGWGLDNNWLTVSGCTGTLAIVDAVPVEHWRPAGIEMRRTASDLGWTPKEEAEHFYGAQAPCPIQVMELVTRSGRRIAHPAALAWHLLQRTRKPPDFSAPRMTPRFARFWRHHNRALVKHWLRGLVRA